jgi:Mn-dependent DtxR family transcriptional regulator
MKHNQSAEDYLEAILILSKQLQFVHQIDVARKLGVSQPAVQKALRLLKGNGYITTDGLHIYLTEQGNEYATNVYSRHCTICKFLELHGVNPQDANDDACELEHAVSDATFAMMKEYVQTHSQKD